MMDFINQIEPWIDSNELFHLKRAIDSKYIVEHNLTREFESMVMEHTKSKYAIAVTNGTMALYCCLLAIGISPGDEVIVPNLTFVATANAVIMAGATPIFCEVDSVSLCIDTNKIESLITNKTKAIIPVHLYGNSSDMDEILRISKIHKLKIIEDAAQGVGVFYNKNHVGTIGDCGILSYYGNKTITCGEGGIILTNNKEISEKCYRLKNHGRDKKGVFKHEEIGFNFSFTEMQAAIGISQMEKLKLIINKKNQIYDKYVYELNNIGDIEMQKFSKNVDPVHWFTSIFTNTKNELSEFLYKNNIQTRDFFYPLNLQPCYKKYKSNENYDVSLSIYNRGISLPSSYILSENEQDYIISKIKFFYK